jgi:uncharacterized membrane protein
MINAVFIVLSAIIALVIPGLALSYICIPKTDHTSLIERAALSIGLSISYLALATFYVNIAGISVTRLTVYVLAALPLGVACLLYAWRNRREQ